MLPKRPGACYPNFFAGEELLSRTSTGPASPGTDILGWLSKSRSDAGDFPARQAARRAQDLADLYAPGLLAEEATPLARCIDLTRKWAG
jgi:hypothetical protein